MSQVTRDIQGERPLVHSEFGPGPVVVAGPGFESRRTGECLEVAMNGVVWTEAGEARLKDGGMGAAGISGGRRDLQPRSPGVRPRGHMTHSGTGHFWSVNRGEA